MWTVWCFTSPSTGERAIVARRSEPGDWTYEHSFQTIVGTSFKETKEKALADPLPLTRSGAVIVA